MSAALDGGPGKGRRGPARALPALRADLVLLHAPAVLEFRGRRDIHFPFLAASGSIPVTPLFEYIPLGFREMARFLGERGHPVAIVNLATLLLRYPGLALDEVIRAIDAKLVGIDLHWLVHAQGALALADRVKQLRPELPVVMGGISATYYAQELIRRPAVDLVLRGYDTLEPLARLVEALPGRALDGIPNLLWKPDGATVRDNGYVHRPAPFGCGIDWSTLAPQATGSMLSAREVLHNHYAGCVHACGWCGGSRDAFRRIHGTERPMVPKSDADVAFELSTMAAAPDLELYHLYPVGFYNAGTPRAERFLDGVERSRVKSVNYEQYALTPDPLLERMARANPRSSITLSPQSHDPEISRLAGGCGYGPEELEAWIDRALGFGIHKIDVWYFVGMPKQDATSVSRTLDYCERLLARFPRGTVNTLICPMLPILDPGSTFFEDSDRHGYRVFHRTLEDHRAAAERASLTSRINYETRWLSRRDLVHVGFGAVRRLVQARAGSGLVSPRQASWFCARLDDSLALIDALAEIDALPDPAERARQLEGLGDEIARRNDEVLYGGVVDQMYPLSRRIGERWFDELGWSSAALDAALGA
jgi:clorobiocin biosynthesis protein CloN6